MKCFLGLLIFFAQVTFIAQAQRICASDTYMQGLIKADPIIKKSFALAEAQIARVTKNNLSSLTRDTTANEVIIIPVVIHVVYNKSSQNISLAQIQSQLTILNNDYSNSNVDKINTPNAFKNLVADTRIKFILAQVDPTGKRTDGITRKFTTTTSFSAEDAMKVSAQGGEDAWDSKRYLNVWVCYMGGRTLGYSSIPGGPANLDGVVISVDVFGTTANARAPFNLGRTATHEVGHWLGLKHIWGDAVCGTDEVEDTPTQQFYNYGSPVFPHVSNCSPNTNGDLYMNFMDFTDDVTMNMFTNGQKVRMRALFAKNNLRNSFLTSNAWDSTLAQSSSTAPVKDTVVKVIVVAKESASVKVYPNPVHNNVMVDYKSAISNASKMVCIYNVQGYKVFTAQLSKGQTSFNIASLTKGIYILQVEEGAQKVTTKIVKD